MDTQLVTRYVDKAIANQKKGLVIKPAILPGELIAMLKSDSSLSTAFENLTPYKQKEYAEYITEARREATKISRQEKVKPMILAGIGLNDKYL